MRGYNGKSKIIALKEDPNQNVKKIYNPLTKEYETIKLSDYINSMFITDIDSKDSKIATNKINTMYKNINNVLTEELNARNLLNEEHTRRTLENEEKQLEKFTRMADEIRKRINETKGKEEQ